MRELSVQLPESLFAQISELAKAEGITVNQFLATAAAEKMAALMTQEYLENEAAQGRRADFEKVLNAVPDVEPEDHDQI